jgi:hypothetical protein
MAQPQRSAVGGAPQRPNAESLLAPRPVRSSAVAQTARPIEQAGPAQEIDGAQLRNVGPDIEYLPRSELTVVPRPNVPVVIPYPSFDGEADAYTGEFDVFIDDHGGVVRLVSATPTLPGILVSAVREAFQAVTFRPGERDGSPVRSRIRIEVTFDKRK